MKQLEPEIARWRAFVEQRPAVNGRDVDELETHLRDQIADLDAAGLAPDEAFLVAVKRMGSLDDVSREFAREHSGRLWKQLVLAGDEDSEHEPDNSWRVALAFALGAAVTIQVARLAAGFPDDEASWFPRNGALLVVPFLVGYFALRRRLSPRQCAIAAAPFAVAAAAINVFSYADVSTEALVAAHLPVVLWAVVAYAYAAGEVGSHERRMDFVRFTGESFIYFVLIALGGGVLMGLTVLILEPTGVNEDTVAEWMLLSGGAGAVIVVAWLVEWKQRVIENMAPVLTTIFTPLFAVMLATAAIVYSVTGIGNAFDRELLGIFDALLVVVLGLVLYGLSAREPSTSPGWMDRIQLVAVVSALVLDVGVLATMIGRIGDLGFTANRTAALGLNLVLLVNLVGTAWLSGRFLAGRSSFHRLERWQTSYLPVFPFWAAVVVLSVPPLFD